MRTVLLVISLAIPVMAVSQPARASGGGGCGEPISEAAGNAVVIEQFCFEPTVTYVGLGQEVTWTNRDRTRHDVLGSNAAWGSFEWLQPNATTSNVFTEAGVYPYVCTWHPGMSGAVVVGDGGLERLEIAPISRVAKGDGELIDASHAGEMLAVVIGGLLLFGGLSLVRRRSRGGSTES
jgi:plastocyanin